MKILILGGTGLISTAITRELLARGGDVVTLYNRGQTAAALRLRAQSICTATATISRRSSGRWPTPGRSTA